MRKLTTVIRRLSKRKRKHALNRTHYGVMYAVMNEDEACLLSAIKAGAPLNSKIDLEDTTVAGDLDAKTPLHWVASRGNADFLKLLLQAGADPNVKGTWSGRTPLLECPDNLECTRLLLAGGADIHAVDMGGNNVLHYASAGDNFSFLQIRFLVQCGGDVHGKNRLSETLLHKICGYNNHANQRAKAVQLLIRQGVSLDEVDHNGRTALHLAASLGNDECLKALLKGGASVDAADYDGMSPIHFAARKRGGEACVAMLLNAGAEPDYETWHCKHTPLQLAVLFNNSGSVSLLLHYGARPVHCTSNMSRCLRSCCSHHTTCTHGRETCNLGNRQTTLLISNSEKVLAIALATPQTLQALCRTTIRRLAGPHRLQLLTKLQLPLHHFFLYNKGDKLSNSKPLQILETVVKNKSVSDKKRRILEIENVYNDIISESNFNNKNKCDTIGTKSKTIFKDLNTVDQDEELLPPSLRRYLVHQEEYEAWWEKRRWSQVFSKAAFGGRSSHYI